MLFALQDLWKDGGDSNFQIFTELPVSTTCGWIRWKNDTSYKWWSCHSGIERLCKLCRNLPHPAMVARFTVLGQTGHTTLHTVHHKHTTLSPRHSYTDDHRGQLIANVISNSDHITLHTKPPTRVPTTTPQQTSSPDITTVSNTLYNRTSWITQHALSSDHLPITTTINIRHDYRLQQNRRTFTNYKKADWTQFTEDTGSAFVPTTIPTNIHTANRIFTNIILMADKHNIPKGKIHSNCRLLPDHIVCKITQKKRTRAPVIQLSNS